MSKFRVFRRSRLPLLVLTSFTVGGLTFSLFSPDAKSASTASSTASSAANSVNDSQAAPEITKPQPPQLDVSKLDAPLPKNLFVELSKLINPTVVSITTTSNVRNRYRDPLQEFYEDFWGNRGSAPHHQAQPVRGLGTGFIIREDGLIITNNHVVAEADVIKVQLDNNSNKFYEAKVIGRDTLTDIALIKIEAKKTLPYARLGSSKDLEVGEWVAAFGNPYGHSHTMTKGIVSAIGREIAELNRFPFIQTDASINPGNSGGPLVNTRGLVIGVNSAIDARAQGIGFAIPIDNVKTVISQLEKDGRIKRGYIGISIAEIDENVAAQLGMEEPTGALVASLMPSGPAEKAGMQAYDVIVDVAGKKIGSASELQNAIAGLDVGSRAKVTVWRYDDRGKKQEKTLNLTITENPQESAQYARQVKQYFGQKAPFDLGFKIADWSANLSEEFGYSQDAPHNPIVTEVERTGQAASAGIRPGDQILDINRQPVSKAADVVRNLKQQRNIIRLLRGNAMMIVSIGK